MTKELKDSPIRRGGKENQIFEDWTDATKLTMLIIFIEMHYKSWISKMEKLLFFKECIKAVLHGTICMIRFL